MKKSLLAVLLATGVSAFAQTQRLSLYEEFTGETCGPCASTNPNLNALLLTTSNQQKIVAIKWQVPIPSASPKTWSLYQTNKTEIDWRHKGWNGGYSSTALNAPAAGGYGYPSINTSNTTSGVNSAPSGRIDGQHQSVFGLTSDHPFYLDQGAIDAAYAVPSPFQLTMVRAWDATFSAVNLTVNITAAQNFTANGPLIFRCVMVEREITFSVQPGTNGETFFEDVAIKSFPSIQAGTPLAGTWINGATTSFTLNCPIPSYCRDKSEIAMVGFIQSDGDRMVHQVYRADKETLPNDAKAIAALVPDFGCQASVTPSVTVLNQGNNAITDMTITPILDGVPQPNFTWTGSLPVGNSIDIASSPLSPPTPGGHTLDYDIIAVSGNDYNMTNNAIGKGFYLANSYPAGNPVVEPFAATAFPTNGWGMTNADGGASWLRHVTANGPSLASGTGSAKYNFFENSETGDADDLIFPPVSFTLAATPKLTFDVAYAQYQAENDKLEVKVSKDCGATWATVYNKAGATLATRSPYSPFAFTPTIAAQWRTETVMLTGFGNSDVIVKFVATSDFGNNLYIDNVNLDQQCVTQTVAVTASKQNMCVNKTSTLSATGATNYAWTNSTNSTVATGNQLVVAPTTTGTITYTVTSTDTEGCSNSSQITVTVSGCVGLEEVALGGIAHEIFPNPNNGDFVLKGDFSGKTSQIVIYNNLGQNVYEQPIAAGENNIRCQLAVGVYYYTIVEAGTVAGKGNLIIR